MRASWKQRTFGGVGAMVVFLLAPTGLALTITEIHYHPRDGEENLEFIEICNETADPVDLGGYFFSQGVDFTFPERFFLKPRAYVVICADEAAVQAKYGVTNTLGDWSPETSLDNGGEVIEVMNSAGVVEARVRFNDRGRWPAGADGTGHSLSLVSVYARPTLASNWRFSARFGGTPGLPNDAVEPPQDLPSVWINEAVLQSESDAPWIEIFNAGGLEADLSGFYLSTDRNSLAQTTLPVGSIVPPKGWWVVDLAKLGLPLTVSDEDRVFLVLSRPGGESVVDAVSLRAPPLGASVARVPDGALTLQPAAEPTPAMANRVRVPSAIVINEIHYHPLDNRAASEFVELHNSGAESVAIGGWRFTSGIDFTFPAEQTLDPGAYLVVARDPAAIRSRYGLPEAAVIGPETDTARADFGLLADSGERLALEDERGNEVDSVRFADGGDWPRWADGDGSSLELIDPRQDNNFGQAWDASDDSEEAVVQEFAYSGPVSSSQGELHFALAERGIVVVDDIRIRERTIGLENRNTVVERGGVWRYFKGFSAPSDPPEFWQTPEFDDAAWLTAPTSIGFGKSDIVTTLDDMRDGYVSLFLRLPFELPESRVDDDVIIEIEYDDGFAAYINGVEFASMGLPEGERSFDTEARAQRSRTAVFELSAADVPLVAGKNVFAVQVHNRSIDNRDLEFNASLATGRLTPTDGENLLVDGDFEIPDEVAPEWPEGSTNQNWLIQGNHIRSGRSEEMPLSGAGSLKIVATGGGDNKVNRIETSDRGIEAPANGSRAVVSFLARWQIGSPVLLTHGAYVSSSKPSYAHSHRLSVPATLGTPGEINSATLRQIERTGSSNLGPVVYAVGHEPSVPRAERLVQVRAKVTDPDGVGKVTLVYSVGRPFPDDAPETVTVSMAGPDAEGFYQATLPAQPLNTIVVFSIRAVDGVGQTGRYPVDPMDRAHPLVADPALATVDDGRYLVYRHERVEPWEVSSGLRYRFWIHEGVEAYLGSRLLLSNDVVDSTLVFEEEEVYYNTGLRFSGSPFARQRWNESYRVRLPKDRPLHGRIRKFGLEDHQGAGGLDARERVSNYLIRQNQGETRVPFSQPFLVRIFVNARVRSGAREHVNVPNREFLERWFPGDDDGPFFEVDDRHDISDAGVRVTSRDARLIHPPSGTFDPLAADDKEDYRFFFSPRGKNTEDDFSELISLAKLMTPSLTPDEDFDKVIWDRIDVEEFLRIWAIRLNTDDWDTWGARRGKNCYLYLPPNDGRWVLLPWDMELTYDDVSSFLPSVLRAGTEPRIPTSFEEVFRLLNRPAVKRLYYQILSEMVDTFFSSEFLLPYMDELDEIGMRSTNVGGATGYVERRRRRLRTIVEEARLETLPLALTTNRGIDFAVDASEIALEGMAPLEVESFGLVVDGVPAVSLDPVFTGAVNFGFTTALVEGPNEITVLGFDADGNVVGSDSIVVTRNTTGVGESFIRGDANHDGTLTVNDALLTFLHLSGDVVPRCLDALDSDDSGEINITDVLLPLDFLFQRGPPPPPPFAAAGIDPTDDELGCLAGS